MIKIFYSVGCQSSDKAMDWFKERSIDFEKRKIRSISIKELISLLSLTDKGMEEVLKNKGDSQIEKTKQILSSEMTFEEALIFLKRHPELLRSPILIQKEKYMIGYNSEEIRKFLPQKHRKLLKDF